MADFCLKFSNEHIYSTVRYVPCYPVNVKKAVGLDTTENVKNERFRSTPSRVFERRVKLEVVFKLEQSEHLVIWRGKDEITPDMLI